VRRGRGASGDTAPYAVEREIDDLAAVLATVGRPAFLVGVSSGGALALDPVVMAGVLSRFFRGHAGVAATG
jgi:pimeloyl-ACP methyl ester carboxylesterase